MPQDHITKILAGVPKGSGLLAKAIKFASGRPGKQFGPIRLGKELGIKPEHAHLVGARLVRLGHAKHGKFKGGKTWIPTGGKHDRQNSAGLEGSERTGEESQQAQLEPGSGKEAAGGSRTLEGNGPVEVAEIGTPEPIDTKQPEMPSLDKVHLGDLMAHPLAKKSMQELAAAGITGTPQEIGVRLLLPGRHAELGLNPDEAHELGLHYLSLV